MYMKYVRLYNTAEYENYEGSTFNVKTVNPKHPVFKN